MEVHTFKCDVCGTLKQDTNRWWKAWIGVELIHIAAHHVDAQTIQVANLCGFECVSKWVGQQMQKIIGE